MDTETNPVEREDTSIPDERIAEYRAAVAGKPSRMIVPVELRADPEADGGKNITIRGHAAVFDRMSEDLGGFRERIKRGAFRKALDNNDDVRLLVNHDAYPVLARTKSNTLELREDPRGLHVFADVAPTTFAEDLRVSMQRGDIDQMSFGFTVAPDGDTWTQRDGQVVRTITEVDHLFDVSVVTFPAYPQTSVDARANVTVDVDTPDVDAPAEELAGEPSPDLAEAGTDAPTDPAAPTPDDAPMVRVRRSWADALVRGRENGGA